VAACHCAESPPRTRAVSSEHDAFSRAVGALRPYLSELVVVGVRGDNRAGHSTLEPAHADNDSGYLPRRFERGLRRSVTAGHSARPTNGPGATADAATGALA
jgi:hypothetical protein